MTEPPPPSGKFIMAAEEPGESPFLGETEGMAIEPITQWDMFWTRLRRHRLAMISAGVMVFLVVVVLAAPAMEAAGWIDSPIERLVDDGGRTLRNIAPRLNDGTVNVLPPGQEAEPATATALIFGSDDLGRGVFTRVIYGGRASLTVGFVTGMIVAFLGTMVGSIAGYYPGGVDQSLMRFTDLVLGLPLLPIAIVVGRILPEMQFLPNWLKQGPMGIALLLGFLSWGGLARIVRAEFMSLREKEFVEAARAAGASDRRIVFRHILPNAMSPIIVQTTLIVGIAIAVLSHEPYPSQVIPTPTPTWGAMAAEGGRLAVRGFWWELVFSASALITTVLSINFLGDGLRDALDPTQTIERK